jgi:serine protease Do
MHKDSIKNRRLSRGFLTVVAFPIGIVSFASVLMAQDPAAILEDSVIKVVEACERSVVSIALFKPSPVDQIHEEHKNFILPRPVRDVREVDELPNEFGAGCLISPPNSSDRLILTSFHLVRGGPIYPKVVGDDGTKLLIKFTDRRGCRGSIIAADPRSDLAVLRPEWESAEIKPTEFPSMKWETAAAPRKGQFVVLLGNPYAIARDGSASVSWGMISNLTRQPISPVRNQFFEKEESARGAMLYRLGAVLQLDARLNLGLSGGPVLNLKGELIGISTSLAAIEGYEQSVGFALPIDVMTRRIISTLLAGQEVEYGMLGIKPGNFGEKEFQGLRTGFKQQSAAEVLEVTPGSPAAEAKIRPNDLILEVEGKPVLSRADLMRMIGLNSPGSQINVTIWRRGERIPRLNLKVTLGKWPVLDDEGIIETNPRYEPWRGLSVDYATARERFRDAAVEVQGVLITKVKANSPADAVQLQPGNFITRVNDRPVQTPAQFHAEVKKASGIVKVELLGNSQSSIPEIQKGRVVRVPESSIAE